MSEKLDALTGPLPAGTRVRLRVDVDGHPAGTSARVLAMVLRKLRVETPAGAVLELARDQVEPEAGALPAADRSLDEVRDEVLLEVTVGSRAWGLEEEGSDEDLRGIWLSAFDEQVSLYRAPPERVASGAADARYWEVEKALLQALRGDPNTLEMLWSPLVRRATPLGERLRAMRGAFSSRAVFGSFGRYAIGQLRRVERALERRETLLRVVDAVEGGHVASHADLLRGAGGDRDALERVTRSLRDRGLVDSTEWSALVDAIQSDTGPLLDALGEHRPKNAYNLLRLLHSCRRWLLEGEPLIRVEGPLRDELLAVKRRERPIEDTLARARALWAEIEEAAAVTRLPAAGDVAAAEAYLNDCRRHAARRALLTGSPRLTRNLRAAPVAALTTDDLAGYLDIAAPGRSLLVVGLTGAHAYGFPSPDSDLDLKGIHVASLDEALALDPQLAPVERIEDYAGREYDLSSHEVGQAVALLLKGNGNMLERLLGPHTVLSTPAGDELRELARASLSRRVFHHYRGFLSGVRRELTASGHTFVKRALYAYRVALTGLHLLEEGELVTDVRALAPRYGLGGRVDELVAIKSSAEKATHPMDAAEIDAELDALTARLVEARDASRLPADPPNARDLARFVVDVRLEAGVATSAGASP